MKWRLVYLGERDAFECASYSEVFKNARAGDIIPDSIFLYQYAEPTVHFGRGPGLGRVKHKFCEKNGIKVVRFNHPNQVAIFCDKSTFLGQIVYRPLVKIPADEEMVRIQQGVIDALAILGVEACIKKGTNDILMNGKKVAKVSNITYGDIQLSKILINADFNFELAEKSLVPKHDIREDIISLKAKLGREIAPAEMVDALRRGFEPILDAEFELVYEFTEAEKDVVAGLRDKFTSEMWIKAGKWSPVKDYWRPK